MALPSCALAAAILVSAVFVSQGSAAEQCLTREQRRLAITGGQVVSLAAAIRATHARRHEVVKARLCRGPKGLVYRLTLLTRDGKVTHATVDAGTGKLAERR
jgi:hypothetical protein